MKPADALKKAVRDQAPSPAVAPLTKGSDLATHFMECGALGTNLTFSNGSRLLITDDLVKGRILDQSAFGMAAVVARDGMVGQTALLPLGMLAARADSKRREKIERLLALIEETAFDTKVRSAAQSLANARFLEAEVRTLGHELGAIIQPARKRYKQFLDIVRALMEKRISHPLFVDEFNEFTRAVAGKLDFGVYSLCLDRLFANSLIPVDIKVDLLDQIFRFPPLVRKELLTNLMASAKAPPELIQYADSRLASYLTHNQVTEVMLFTTLKLSWAAQRQRQAVRAAAQRH